MRITFSFAYIVDFFLICFLFVNLVASHFIPQNDSTQSSNHKMSLVDERGMEVNNVILTTNVDDISFHLVADIPMHSFSISPELPKGLVLSEKGILSGKPTEAKSSMYYIITANNGDLKAYCFISVIDCSYGPITTISLSLSSFVTLYHNGKEILSRENFQTKHICLEKGSYSFLIEKDSVSTEVTVSFSSLQTLYYKETGVFPFTGSLDMVPSVPPRINLPSFITVPLKESNLLSFTTVSGVLSTVRIEPLNGSESISFSYYTRHISMSFSSPGIRKYKLTATNSIGSVTKEFSIGVDTCEGNDVLLSYTADFSGFVIFRLFDSQHLPLVSVESSTLEGSLCVRPNVPYSILLRNYFENTPLGEQHPLVFSDSMGVVAEFRKPKELFDKEFTLLYNRLVPFKSSISYSKVEEQNWMKKKLNGSWSEGTSDMWGNYEGDHVYFRKEVVLSDTHYSLLLMDITANDPILLYVNEVEVTQVKSSSNVSNRLVIPLSYLQKGNNLIALQMTKTSSRAIHFDIQLATVGVPNYEVSVGGSIVEKQQTMDPDHPASNAFDGSESTYWAISGYPASVEYTFPYSQSLVVSEIAMKKYEGDIPSSIRIEGVNADHSVTLLLTMSDTFMSVFEWEHISFSNRHVYPTYRVTIEASKKNETIKMQGIRLLTSNPLTCKKKAGIDNASTDTTYLKNCPFTQVGKKQLKCVNLNYEATWVDDRSACLPRYPSSEFAYIDFTIAITNLQIAFWNSVKDKVTNLITSVLTVHAKDISYVLIHDDSSSNTYITRIGIRFTVNVRIGDYIIYCFNDFANNFGDLVTKYLGKEYTGSVVETAVLHNPVNWTIIIVSLVITLLTLCIICMFIYIRKLNPTTVKKLEKSKSLVNSEKESLISFV